MDRDNEQFTPDAVDEQIERLLEDPQLRAHSSQQHMVHELQNLYKKDAPRLEHIWERLSEHAQQRAKTNHPVDIQLYQQQRLKRFQLQHQAPPQPRHTSRQRLSRTLAVLVAALLVCSVIVVFPLVRNVSLLQGISQTQGIIMSNGQGLSKVDIKTGIVLWNFPIPHYSLDLSAHPIVTKDLVFIESQNTLYAIDVMTGTQRWSYVVPSQVSPYGPTKANLVLSGNAIYLSIEFMSVVALNMESGKVLHTYPINLNTSPSALAIENNMLYVAGQSDMCAINLNTGALAWHQIMSQTRTLGMLHVVNGTIYTTLSDDTYDAYTTLNSANYVKAYNAKDGSELWSSKPMNSAISEVTVADGVVYNGASDGVVYDGTSDGSVSAYDARTGHLLWSKSLNEGSFNGFVPLVDANNVYVGITPATSQATMGLLALNKRNGNVQWQYPTQQDIEHSGRVFDTPVLQNSMIYVQVEGMGNNPNEVYAIHANGSVAWHNTIQ